MIDLRHEYWNNAVPRRLVSFARYAESQAAMGIEAAENKIYLSDFTAPEHKTRYFAGNIKCKIIDIEKDTKTETVVLGLVFAG
jgi:hypothetical protein